MFDNRNSGGSRRSRLGGHRGGQGFGLGGQWRARSASLYGGLGACPSGVQGQSTWPGGQGGGLRSPEAKEVFCGRKCDFGSILMHILVVLVNYRQSFTPTQAAKRRLPRRL